MLGINYVKFQPSTYVIVYKKGEVIKEGVGLSFFYYSPTTSLVAIPASSIEVPFIFEETTDDFQTVTIQGQVTYRISEPKKIAQLLNFTIDSTGRYLADDPKTYVSRIINLAKVAVKQKVQGMPLKDALKATETLVKSISTVLKSQEEITTMGLNILGLAILAIKPVPETSRALEAEAREKILKEADDAIYLRRNSAIEQERQIKQNEFDTAIAIENKNKQISEAKMDAEQAIQKRQHELKEAELNNSIGLEEKRKKLVLLAVENAKQEADSKAYSVSAIMKALDKVDPNTIKMLANMGMQPNQMIAMAFQELADKAEKIGQLNITPDLLSEIMKKNR